MSLGHDFLLELEIVGGEQRYYVVFSFTPFCAERNISNGIDKKSLFQSYYLKKRYT